MRRSIDDIIDEFEEAAGITTTKIDDDLRRPLPLMIYPEPAWVTRL